MIVKQDQYNSLLTCSLILVDPTLLFNKGQQNRTYGTYIQINVPVCAYHLRIYFILPYT